MSRILNTQRVEETFKHCLFRNDEAKYPYLLAPGISCDINFHPGRIAEKLDDIVAMLAELPAEFQEEAGDGGSFLNACTDKNGDRWTSFHLTLEQLIQLGIASGTASYLMPRETWAMLPGGMPYIIVHAKPKTVMEVTSAA